MTDKPRIAVLALGGTIAMVKGEQGGPLTNGLDDYDVGLIRHHAAGIAAILTGSKA